MSEIAELQRELAEMERIALHWQTIAHELITLSRELLIDGAVSANLKASRESGACDPKVTTVLYANWIERSEAAALRDYHGCNDGPYCTHGLPDSAREQQP